MTWRTKVKKKGHNFWLVLPLEITKKYKVGEGSEIDLIVKGNHVIIERIASK